MKLLFDQNLSFRLLDLLSDLYPDSTHVREVGLEASEDQSIWDFARRGGFAIVTKDFDFHQRSYFHGPPPKVIWIRLGNCSTNDVARLLLEHSSDIEGFHKDPDAALLALA